MLIRLRFRFSEVFFGMLLAATIFALGGAFWSAQNPSHPTQPQSAANGTDEKDQRQEHEGLWNWVTHDAAGFFTLWLVIVGGGQVALFYVQLKLIRESLNDAKVSADAAKGQGAETLRSNFLARFNKHFLSKPDDELFERIYTEDPRLYFSSLVQLAKVYKVEMGEAGAFDDRPRPREIGGARRR
jgi:hypothetical protein